MGRSKIGFVSGCFDGLTPAHFQLFALARQRCDELDVLIADDATVRLFKGDTRPFVPFRQRVVMLDGCKYVDNWHRLRITHDSSNKRELIKNISPDIYFEGIDSTDKEIGAYLDEFGIDRIQLDTKLPHLSEYLRDYDLKRYDQTRVEYIEMRKVAGL